MEKRRIRLNINGVVCGIITEESDEYMQTVSDEVGQLMAKIMASSPNITREAAALTVALSYCDDAKQTEDRLQNMKQKAADTEKRALEIERQSVLLKKENKQLWEETEALLNQPDKGFSEEERQKLTKKISELEGEIIKLRGKVPAGTDDGIKIEPQLKNPLRQNDHEAEGFISFFKKEDE